MPLMAKLFPGESLRHSLCDDVLHTYICVCVCIVNKNYNEGS